MHIKHYSEIDLNKRGFFKVTALKENFKLFSHFVCVFFGSLSDFFFHFSFLLRVHEPSQLISDAPVTRPNKEMTYIPLEASNKQINNYDGDNI